jgi:hypothetical protein
MATLRTVEEIDGLIRATEEKRNKYEGYFTSYAQYLAAAPAPPLTRAECKELFDRAEREVISLRNEKALVKGGKYNIILVVGNEGTAQIENLIQSVKRLEFKVDNMNSQGSNSLSDINDVFERYAKRVVQNKLLAMFKTYKTTLNPNDKSLRDQKIFDIIKTYIPRPETNTDQGQVDAYFAVKSPLKWEVIDIQSGIFVVSGSFAETALSLNRTKQSELIRTSPTTAEFPNEFNYYCIFEITTGADLSHKLNQLESQLQYLLARDFQRYFSDLHYPPIEVTRKKNNKNRKAAYQDFVASRIVNLVAFCGLILSKEYSNDFETKIINIINHSNGYERPCLWKLLSEKRFIYMKSETLTD